MGLRLGGPGLRVPRHRTTTAHLCAAYPFQAEAGLGARGIYLGTNALTGGGAFAFDAFEFYTQGLLTNTNMLVLGEPGWGKSASVKTLLHRSVGVLKSPSGGPRWVAIADPKGEYEPLAEALGLDLVRLRPGGTTRVNPLDPGPVSSRIGPAEIAVRRTSMATALLEAVLRRDLLPLEDAAVGWAIEHMSRPSDSEPTLLDLAQLLADPTEEMAVRAACSVGDLAHSLNDVRFALGKLLDRQLRGMFDGRSNVHIDWSGRGVVLDLSAVFHDREALTLVMIAAIAWLQALMATPEGEDTPRRVQVLDEAWALLSSERTAKYLQSCWKLCRSYGVANIAVAHRLSDLRSQADDGTSAAKVAMGLLADTQTRVVFRQASDQVPETADLLGLNSAEAFLLSRLVKGRALWKVAGRAAVVQHVIGPAERALCYTDGALVV
ncbi:MAG TPA: hypothetical protein VMZ73_08325 [Acidimicrobiales bacterium]|nr:hypothetical protein [Acidimicrobiales bacterium]